MTLYEAKRVLEFDLKYLFNDETIEALRLAISVLDGRPKGEWITDNGFPKCSRCEKRAKEKHKYCPDCGAKMQ